MNFQVNQNNINPSNFNFETMLTKILIIKKKRNNQLN